jgi:cytochrome c1
MRPREASRDQVVRGNAAVLLAAVFCLGVIACRERSLSVRETAAMLTGGDPDRGRAAISRYGCGGCHNIPGVDGANATVGPPLDNIAMRSILGGHLPNTPANMMRWIQKPQAVDPKNVMPDMNVTDDDARDITAYLYTLRP